jgi:hypothetical protein
MVYQTIRCHISGYSTLYVYYAVFPNVLYQCVIEFLFSKGRNKVHSPRHFTWGRKQIWFPKRRVLYNTGPWTKSRNVVILTVDRAVAQAARVRAQVRLCGICGGQSDTGACFPWVLRFPLLPIPPTHRHSSSSITIQGWYSRLLVASVSPYPKKLKEKIWLLVSGS